MLTLPVKHRSSEVIEVPRWVQPKSGTGHPLRNSSRFKELREMSKKRKNEDEQDSNTRSASLNETIKVWGRLVDDSRQPPPGLSSGLLTQRLRGRPRAGTRRAWPSSPGRSSRRGLRRSGRGSDWSSRRCRLRPRSRPSSSRSSPRCLGRKSPPRATAPRPKRESRKSSPAGWRTTGPSSDSLRAGPATRGRRSWSSGPARRRSCGPACRCRCCGDGLRRASLRAGSLR